MLTGILLAGGNSSRMGRDKSRVFVAGEMLVRRAHASLSEVCGEVLVVGGDVGDVLPHAQTVEEARPGEGPLSALVAGLARVKGSKCVVLACDLPFASGHLLAWLAGQIGDLDAVVPVDENDRAQPLCAAYRDSASVPLAQAQAAGERSVVRAIRALRVSYVPFDQWSVADPAGGKGLFNVNTPAELAAAQRLAGGRGDRAAKSQA